MDHVKRTVPRLRDQACLLLAIINKLGLGRYYGYIVYNIIYTLNNTDTLTLVPFFLHDPKLPYILARGVVHAISAKREGFSTSTEPPGMKEKLEAINEVSSNHCICQACEKNGKCNVVQT